MKTLATVLVSALLGMSACSDDFLEENPRGQLASEGFFNNNADLELAVTAMYNKVNISVSIDDWTAPLMGGDDVTSHNNKQVFLEFDIFDATNQNVRLSDAWTNYYGLVNAANFIINGYEEATEASEEERRLAAAQAHFFRAHAYYYIVRVWNEAPLVSTQNIALDIENSSPNQIYELILADLEKAESMLPNSWEGKYERIAPTRGAAKSLLSSVYLTMAGYPINDASKYALAAQKAKEVINEAPTWGYSLLEDFGELWRDRPHNSEIIYGAYYNNQIAADNFADYNVRAPFPSQPKDENGWSDYFAEINFFLNFPEGPRKDATFQTIIRPNETDTLTWQEGLYFHPYYHKMRAANGEQNLEEPWKWFNWMLSRTNVFMRYAEVLLIYAEAKAMSDGPDQTAYDAVNSVRSRAQLPDLTPGLSNEVFRDSVVQERAWEFAGLEYNARWHDLVRLELVEEANANRHPDEAPFTNQPSKEYYFMPIPFKDSQINPNIDKS